MNIPLTEIHPLEIIKYMHNYFISKCLNLRQPKCPAISIRLDNFTSFIDVICTHLKNIIGITIEIKVHIIQSWGQK